MKKASIAGVAVCTVAILCLAVSRSPAQDHRSDAAHSWTYSGDHGPEHWGGLSPEFAVCSNGREQSPINITDPQTAALPPLHFAYHTSPLKIIDNGHTIQINYAPAAPSR